MPGEVKRSRQSSDIERHSFISLLWCEERLLVRRKYFCVFIQWAKNSSNMHGDKYSDTMLSGSKAPNGDVRRETPMREFPPSSPLRGEFPVPFRALSNLVLSPLHSLFPPAAAFTFFCQSVF